MDYARFCQMLLNGGRLHGERPQVASRSTVNLMTANHLPRDGTQYGPGLLGGAFGGLAQAPVTGYGFGLGFAVRTAPGQQQKPGAEGNASLGRRLLAPISGSTRRREL